MNRNMQQLTAIAQKKQRRIIGLMSGTSVDGLDIAYCTISGEGHDTAIELTAFETIAYDPDFKAEIKSVFSKKEVDFEKLCLLNPWVAQQQAAMINTFLQKNKIKKEEVDLIASHGQTVYHAPKALHQQEKFSNATLQIGDGDHMAVETGIITISDFRQKHIAAGGEGAPLAVYGDYFIFSKKGEDRIMLNMGGIANFTFLPGSMDANKIFSTDTGTGNTLMDALMQQHFPGKYFDEDSAVAKKGTINALLLKALKDHPFFQQSFPKTTGPELFNLHYLQTAKEKSGTTDLNVNDTMATLNAFSAQTIAEAIIKTMPQNNNFHLYASGGGMHNPLLMEQIKQLLPTIPIHLTSELGINPDAKEAVLFAILANECIAGGNVQFSSELKGIPSVTMGKISFPW
ncbi:anhydro-N-acetylmuramic acid kinase [Lacibacter sp.]|uniref:anhydro-N-acetylmuramic acid kinase n=1 Tax=Lacibacter sp. TaxID=1915409 RepID=UPI002B4B8571|nr:anhydro-N-acetylmuramic acid kinase [Lacibacter sp.]HLP35914.1 anhydro-N-acetylmuramic acid kinase [Lacibacter sp.]